MDALYIGITIIFFAAATLFVRACAALGREGAGDGRGGSVN